MGTTAKKALSVNDLTKKMVRSRTNTCATYSSCQEIVVLLSRGLYLCARSSLAEVSAKLKCSEILRSDYMCWVCAMPQPRMSNPITSSCSKNGERWSNSASSSSTHIPMLSFTSFLSTHFKSKTMPKASKRDINERGDSNQVFLCMQASSPRTQNSRLHTITNSSSKTNLSPVTLLPPV